MRFPAEHVLLTAAQGRQRLTSSSTASAGSPPSSDARLQRDGNGSPKSVFRGCYVSRLQTHGWSPRFPAQPSAVPGGPGRAMPGGSCSPSCALDSWQRLSARPQTSLILPRKGKMGCFPIASPRLAFRQFPSMPAERQARPAHQKKAERFLTRRVKRLM